MITLINPPGIKTFSGLQMHTPNPPLGLAYVAAAVRDAGFDYRVIDATGEALDAVSSYPDRADGTLFNVRKQHAPPKFFPNCGVWKFSDKKGLGLATIWRNRARFRRNLNNFVLASSKILIICPNITWQYK